MRTAQEYRDMVKRPGKFEGEQAWAPYFWELVMNSEGESVYGEPDEEGEMELLYDRFRIDGNDIELFPELEPYRGAELRIWEDGWGFVISAIKAK